MNRRQFLQSMSALAGSFSIATAYGRVQGISQLKQQIQAQNPLNVEFSSLALDATPQIINIFLYGAPSELAGNLSNITDIMANSQNAYPNEFKPDDAATIVTPNYFWRTAGGTEMEAMLKNRQMTIYRTMHRVKDDNKAHGRSVQQNLVGNLDINSPGFATTLAWVIQQNNPFSKPVDELLFPFVSFEGESKVFQLGNLDIPLALKPVALNSNLQNPYQRSTINGASYLDSGSTIDKALDALAKQRNKIVNYEKLITAFEKRAYMADKMGALLSPTAVDNAIADYNSRLPADGQINYGTGNFGQRLKAAISLCLSNRETVFISLGSGGLGGWDDHSQALDNYPGRMQELMSSIQAAMTHLEAAANDSVKPVASASGVIINVFGDFGRNVNLNNSKGWDHGNNQNYYTFGGAGIAGRQLGKIIGTTKREGESGINRQFTVPTAESYQFEPFAVASTLYRYFGVNNPEVLNGEAAIDETLSSNPIV